MVNIIFIYMHICKCIQYTHDDDVASLCKKVLYLMIEELHHQVQLCEIQYFIQLCLLQALSVDEKKN